MNLVAIPAYGRDYKSADELILAWEQGLDFISQDPQLGFGKYFNIDNAPFLKEAGKEQIQFRYKKLACVHVIKI